MAVSETARLRLRHLAPTDAPFILELVNEPGWLRFIGDRGVHDLESARGYIERGPRDMYTRLRFGLYCVESKADSASIGLCGLIKRDTLEDVDLGFALLERHQGRGYAREAARATLDEARGLGLRRVAAITSPDNERSILLLTALGFRFVHMRNLTPEEPPVRFFLWQSSDAHAGAAV